MIPIDQVQNFGNIADSLSRSISISSPVPQESFDSIPYYSRDEYIQAQCPYQKISRKRKRSVFENYIDFNRE